MKTAEEIRFSLFFLVQSLITATAGAGRRSHCAPQCHALAAPHRQYIRNHSVDAAEGTALEGQATSGAPEGIAVWPSHLLHGRGRGPEQPCRGRRSSGS